MKRIRTDSNQGVRMHKTKRNTPRFIFRNSSRLEQEQLKNLQQP